MKIILTHLLFGIRQIPDRSPSMCDDIDANGWQPPL